MKKSNSKNYILVKGCLGPATTGDLTSAFSGSLISQYLDYLPTIVQLATSTDPHLIGLNLSKQKERLEVLHLLRM